MEPIIEILPWPRALHGEGITFNSNRSVCYWVDITGQKLFVCSMADNVVKSFSAPTQVGFVIPLSDDQLLCGLASGLAYFFPQSEQWIDLGDPAPQFPNNRFNDAKIDKQGVIWANTMDQDAAAPNGQFLRCVLTGNDSVEYHLLDEGFLIGNGPTWSLNGDVIYHAETEKNSIFAYDVSSSGAYLSNKRLFYRHSESGMGPDGMRTDGSGNVWVAMAHGGKIIVISPTGELVDDIKLPVRFPTSLTFTASDCREFLVTSSQIDGLGDDSHAGQVLRVRKVP
jgi:D-xylonolactonase